MWGANLAGKCVVCRLDKAVAPHPTMGWHICLMRRWRVLSGLPEEMQFIELVQPCRSDKAFTPHPTMGWHICLMRRCCVLSGLGSSGHRCKKACSLSRLFEFGRCQRITRHFVARPAGRCWRNVLSLRSSRTSLPPEVLILFRLQKAKNQPVGWFF
ncbi:hypothetical protein WC5_01468 [Escherichia sp. KTE114]|nr:hypothetical protein WC5_01468 [Escherichia sp. KTE114]